MRISANSGLYLFYAVGTKLSVENKDPGGEVSEKAMATHSHTLAWKIPWMEEPGGLPSMGSHRVGYD